MKIKLFVIFTLVVILLGLNPYMEPNLYDNVTYYLGAQSLAHNGVYAMNGAPILDWPPLFSAILAIPMFFGFESLVISKLIVFLFVLLCLWVITHFFHILKREPALFFAGLTALLPVGSLQPTMMFTEWPFVFFSTVFLLSIHQIERGERKPFWIFLGTISLAASFFLHYRALLLIVALLLYAVWNLVRKQPSLPYFLIGSLSSFLFFLFWIVPIYFILGTGFSSSKYYTNISFIKMPALEKILTPFSDLFFRAVTVSRFVFSNLDLFLGIIILAFVIYGLGLLKKAKSFYFVDFCTVFSIACLCFHKDNKARYLLSFAPFLLYYFYLGIRSCAEKYRFSRVLPYLLGCWIICLFALRGVLLIYGNGIDYSGSAVFVSPTPEKYYLGIWRELYTTCHSMNPQKQGPLATKCLPQTRYIVYFSGRHVEEFDSKKSNPYVLAAQKGHFSREEVMKYHLHPLIVGQHVILYERDQLRSLPSRKIP
jgi:hypothetical protein